MSFGKTLPDPLFESSQSAANPLGSDLFYPVIFSFLFFLQFLFFFILVLHDRKLFLSDHKVPRLMAKEIVSYSPLLCSRGFYLKGKCSIPINGIRVHNYR
ncbi:hypothetical protein K1719_010150 [Acacia pycnantha]|nr:hypothetical protein K1719_010150 [Acacia pycnantha]